MLGLILGAWSSSIMLELLHPPFITSLFSKFHFYHWLYWHAFPLILQTSSKRQHHLNKHLYRPSTFLTSYEPPVFMDEDDERSVFYNSVQDPSGDDSVSHLLCCCQKTKCLFVLVWWGPALTSLISWLWKLMLHIISLSVSSQSDDLSVCTSGFSLWEEDVTVNTLLYYLVQFRKPKRVWCFLLLPLLSLFKIFVNLNNCSLTLCE